MSIKPLLSRPILLTLLGFLLLLLLWLWLGRETKRKAIELPDSAKMEVRIHRFDQELYALKDSLSPQRMSQLRQKYGNFFKIYIEEIVALTGINDPGLHEELGAFLSDPYIDTLFRDVQKQFPELSAIEAELSEAYSYFYYLFPDQPFYRPMGMVSAFQFKNALSDSALMLGLDLHLGRHYVYYPKVSYITAYMLPRLEPNRMVPDAMRMMIEDMLPPMGSQPNLISEMVNAGKALYVLQSIIPGIADSLLLNYTAEQSAWAATNELSIWEYLLNENLLYSNDRRMITRLMNDGPFTAGLPQDSPPRLGAFVGWKMVSRFMNKNKEVNLPELLQTPPQEIVKASRYKGKS
ncbi:MAG: hypothetical protein ACK417_07105 [Bacteroidia bacterium]